MSNLIQSLCSFKPQWDEITCRFLSFPFFLIFAFSIAGSEHYYIPVI